MLEIQLINFGLKFEIFNQRTPKSEYNLESFLLFLTKRRHLTSDEIQTFPS